MGLFFPSSSLSRWRRAGLTKILPLSPPPVNASRPTSLPPSNTQITASFSSLDERSGSFSPPPPSSLHYKPVWPSFSFSFLKRRWRKTLLLLFFSVKGETRSPFFFRPPLRSALYSFSSPPRAEYPFHYNVLFFFPLLYLSIISRLSGRGTFPPLPSLLTRHLDVPCPVFFFLLRRYGYDEDFSSSFFSCFGASL